MKKAIEHGIPSNHESLQEYANVKRLCQRPFDCTQLSFDELSQNHELDEKPKLRKIIRDFFVDYDAALENDADFFLRKYPVEILLGLSPHPYLTQLGSNPYNICDFSNQSHLDISQRIVQQTILLENSLREFRDLVKKYYANFYGSNIQRLLTQKFDPKFWLLQFRKIFTRTTDREAKERIERDITLWAYVKMKASDALLFSTYKDNIAHIRSIMNGDPIEGLSYWRDHEDRVGNEWRRALTIHYSIQSFISPACSHYVVLNVDMHQFNTFFPEPDSYTPHNSVPFVSFTPRGYVPLRNDEFTSIRDYVRLRHEIGLQLRRQQLDAELNEMLRDAD